MVFILIYFILFIFSLTFLPFHLIYFFTPLREEEWVVLEGEGQGLESQDLPASSHFCFLPHSFPCQPSWPWAHVLRGVGGQKLTLICHTAQQAMAEALEAAEGRQGTEWPVLNATVRFL